jgi:hypothetical protein
MLLTPGVNLHVKLLVWPTTRSARANAARAIENDRILPFKSYRKLKDGSRSSSFAAVVVVLSERMRRERAWSHRYSYSITDDLPRRGVGISFLVCRIPDVRSDHATIKQSMTFLPPSVDCTPQQITLPFTPAVFHHRCGAIDLQRPAPRVHHSAS